MGVAAGDYNGDGRTDLFVTQLARPDARGVASAQVPAFVSRLPGFATAFGTNFTGWGDSWVDLNDGTSISRSPTARSR